MESGVEFEAVDFPQANRLTIHILAAVAGHGAKAISDRTKAALAADKARGVKLGGPHTLTVSEDVRRLGQEAIQKRADAGTADYASAIRELQTDGATSLRAIAAALNERGISTLPIPRELPGWEKFLTWSDRIEDPMRLRGFSETRVNETPTVGAPAKRTSIPCR
jgi:DNA invertase Pin-like site-specific DNA recombinase